MDSKYADKIAALFAKAEGTDNEAERETFTNAALKLMAKWGVDDAMAAAAAEKQGAAREAMVKGTVSIKGTYNLAWIQLASWIRNGLNAVQLVKNGDEIIVVGADSDVQRFISLYDSLKSQAEGSMKEWWKQYAGTHTPGTGFRHRRQFLVSFSIRVGQRLMDERKQAETETTGAELVLVDRAKRAQLAVRDLVGPTRVRHSRGFAGGGTDARAAGSAAGDRASLGKRHAAVTA